MIPNNNNNYNNLPSSSYYSTTTNHSDPNSTTTTTTAITETTTASLNFQHPWSSDDFKNHLQTTGEFITEYYEKLIHASSSKDQSFPVCSQVQPGYLAKLLPSEAPLKGEQFEDILKDISEKIIPGVTHWQHPNFYSFFSANFSYPALIGDMFSGMFNVIGFSWITSPACTELETIVMDWLAKALHLPKFYLSETTGGGSIQDTASSAGIVAILSAKEAKRSQLKSQLGQDQFNEADFQSKLVCYVSDQTHSSIQKACMVTGVLHLRKIPSFPSTYDMNYNELEKAIEQDEKNGLIPFFVCGTIGTTSSTAIDDLSKIGPICKQHGIFLHVDAAFLGATLLLPECRNKFVGDECEALKYSDSFTFNPHKWMLTNFDCCAFWIKERKHLKNALSIDPEYLKNKASATGLVTDYRDWQIPLGRRFRSLKLWFVMRIYGIEGLQSYLRHHIELAKYFENHIQQQASRFEIVAPRVASLVCFHAKLSTEHEKEWTLQKENRLNEILVERINASGLMYLSHTVLSGKYSLRMAICGSFTNFQHVQFAISTIEDHLSKLLESVKNGSVAL
ncbi:hypothetical protein C9374_001666 [Naegleria lovaniensis]|uniref:Tyrosine decarboxylase n=1 Tax=Naegleria lovaniensis TaxID=51637 RepID=A0AA88GX70_NAELO|nr:uncharacterized protein C9374_001666 [Naegleria lovaniensis]KAG2387334.1 hypothetical protein C9374_001666 [Naegleria lovaniensis]